MFIKPFQTMVLLGDADKVGETFDKHSTLL